MKNRFWLRIMGMVLVFTMMISFFELPAMAAANDTEEYLLLEVTSSDAVIRSKAKQNSSVYTTVHEGDILYCTDSTKNIHGNVWFECIFVSEDSGTKQTGWIFSHHVAQHHHELSPVAEDCDLELRFCRCGYYETNPADTQWMNSVALPMDRPLVSPEEVAIALGALKRAGLKIGSSLINAVPYVMIPLAVGGIAYMAYVYCNTTTAEVLDVKKMTKEFHPKDYEDGKYYYSAIYNKPSETDGVYSTVLLLPVNPMDMKEAANYVEKVIKCTGLLHAVVDNFTVKVDSVYTPHQNDAKRLCEELKSRGFYYGGHSRPDECSEHNLDPRKIVANWLYFEHYHVHYNDSLTVPGGVPSHLTKNSVLKKASGHIFFGVPFSYNGNALNAF